ncbi:MAG: hypothetical protein U9R29_09915 [Thermodesulfobacteriota bacterium]|nr:hypothetical protein [Thermodesulfobacteriota bacterium]
MTDVLVSEHLANGVQIDFVDKTNRYYGDYHRVCIDVELRFAVDNHAVAHKFQTLERMGVSGDDVTVVQTKLIDSFRCGTMPYMERPVFPDKFMQSLVKRKSILLPGLK